MPRRNRRRDLNELFEIEVAAPGGGRPGRGRRRRPQNGPRQEQPRGAEPDAPRPPTARPTPRGPRQEAYLSAMAAGDGVFGVGPQGSGKTFLPAAFGACLLNDGDVRKMVVCRPTTDAGESLGFLPGGLEEKLEPWMVPIFDAIDKTVGRQKRIAWQRAGMLEVCSFQHMQGRTFEDSFVLLDEAQNADNMQMETFLTRIGVGSRYVVAGDPFAQRVARGPGGFARAIEHARRHGLPVPIVEMTYQDIQRHEHARLWALAFHDDHTQPEKRP